MDHVSGVAAESVHFGADDVIFLCPTEEALAVLHVRRLPRLSCR